MGRIYVPWRINRSKYNPPCNTPLLEEARRGKIAGVQEGSGAGGDLPADVDSGGVVGGEDGLAEQV